MNLSILKQGTACFLAICITLTAGAQDKLFIKGKTPDKYVVYKTNGKESLQSISNGFGMAVQKLASYNKTNVNATKAFAKGTEIKIPITKDNLLQHPADNAEPVVHVIGKGENLFRVSQAYHKVPLASLRSWNQLKKDAVKPGQEIIVGYMVNAKASAAPDKKPDPRKEESVASAPQEKPREKEVKTNILPPPAEATSDKKESAPVRTEAASTGTQTIPLTPSKTSANTKSVAQPAATETNGDYVPREGDEGYFAAQYGDHPKEQTQQFRSGDAAVFKTISGWSDRKFYVLMNDIAPKTIVRITGAANKSICAMVLGPLQETKDGTGLLLRLSNSAASALGLAGDKFTVTVTYFE